jgi:hypothetical protein
LNAATPVIYKFEFLVLSELNSAQNQKFSTEKVEISRGVPGGWIVLLRKG